MEKVRIGCVNYLNTLPLIEGLDLVREVELRLAVPARLVSMLERDEADVALVSLIDAVRSEVPLTILPCGMIGSDGPTLTVRLFSQIPIEQVRTIHADTDSHTSVALCRVLMLERFGHDPAIVDYHAREQMPSKIGGSVDSDEWPEAVLLIGDKVVSGSPPAVRYPYQLDLGECWKEQTGLPFVYAVWMCRSDRVEDPLVRRAWMVLDRQRRHNRTRIDAIATDRAAEHRWPVDLARTYLGSRLAFEYDQPARKAAERFVGLCAERGITRQAGLVHADEQLATASG
ncbi:MAG TPA: hypothetical protein ENJ00_11745 [Phycisphaerales bacterium]|nr:hypothetical protein [Phycisphaerales bacterium]